MKKKTKLLSVFLLSTAIMGCDNLSGGESFSTNLSPESNESQASSETLSTQEESSTSGVEYTQFLEIEDIYLEVGETYYLKDIFADYKGLIVVSHDNEITSYNSQTKMLNAYQEGETNIVLKYKGQNQLVKVVVGKIGSNYSFSKERLYSKEIVAFGDSVTADATIGNSGKTYSRRFASRYEMNYVNNYAIGGTTATYMYKGSNIYKEYANNKTAIDGCRVVYNAYKKGELAGIDYAFIAYGHNDQYFQPPISVQGDDVYCIDGTFATCNSYKGSYRYMINVLRKANPNIRIIVLNCTYSEYDKANPSPYGSKYCYEDYRIATKEIAEEMGCKYIDPWDYMKELYDYGRGNINYSDSVHITAIGHQKLSQFISQF